MARNGGCNSGCNGEWYGERYGERDSVACNGGRNDGHFTVTLACSFLAEAAQATTPPIPLLVAPAQGLGPTLGARSSAAQLLSSVFFPPLPPCFVSSRIVSYLKPPI